MPHKRNPAASLLALEAAQRAPGLAATLLAQLAPEHERGLGQWQSQWLTLRGLLGGAASALGAMAEVLEALQIDTVAMANNLEQTGGLVFSEALALRLARTHGKPPRTRSLKSCAPQAVLEKRHLREVAKPVVPAGELEAIFDARRAFRRARDDRARDRWRETAP